jgi:dTDP-4-amino-4,6-dideoxygalactose transaminase
LEAGLIRRREIAAAYRDAFAPLGVGMQEGETGTRRHAWHLFVIQVPAGVDRKAAYASLREAGIPVNVHYAPVYRHRFYQERFGDQTGRCPNAERYYERALTLPLSPRMSHEDVEPVIAVVNDTLAGCMKS